MTRPVAKDQTVHAVVGLDRCNGRRERRQQHRACGLVDGDRCDVAEATVEDRLEENQRDQNSVEDQARCEEVLPTHPALARAAGRRGLVDGVQQPIKGSADYRTGQCVPDGLGGHGRFRVVVGRPALFERRLHHVFELRQHAGFHPIVVGLTEFAVEIDEFAWRLGDLVAGAQQRDVDRRDDTEPFRTDGGRDQSLSLIRLCPVMSGWRR